MTVSLALATVADSISKISISGVTVKDVNELSASWKSLPNVLYPRPDGFVTGLRFKTDSYGINGAEKGTFTYNLTYRFLGTAVGNMGTFGQAYSDALTKIIAIVNAIVADDTITGATKDFRLGTIANIGPMPDPSGNVFHGADITFVVEEFVN